MGKLRNHWENLRTMKKPSSTQILQLVVLLVTIFAAYHLFERWDTFKDFLSRVF